MSACEDTGALKALHEVIDPDGPAPDPLDVVRAAGRYARAAGVEQGEIVLAIIGTVPEPSSAQVPGCSICGVELLVDTLVDPPVCERCHGEDEDEERDETTADCECCLCCRAVPCSISMDGGPCDRLACLREARATIS